MDLVVIDGPNLFNAVASRIVAEPELLRLYLEECFDMDRLAIASLAAANKHGAPPRMGIVIFHSLKPLGRD
jgi:hypothetical protein